MSSVVVRELHHHVLADWREDFLKHGGPVRVLCLDHHADAVSAFRHFSGNDENTFSETRRKFLSENTLQSDKLFRHIPVMLRHDEQFDAAVRLGIFREAVLLTHTRFLTELPDGITVLCDPPCENEVPHAYGSREERALFDRALESSFLRERLGTHLTEFLAGEPFILDIDCDYFKTRRALAPRDSEVFDALVRASRTVTISLENDWVRILSLDTPALDAREVLGALLTHFRRAGRNC